ncbi:hypothetical protein ACFL0V_00245 [Nanoarchaeota archaeon]
MKDCLDQVTEEEVFKLNGGGLVSSIPELYRLLPQMDPKIFYFHVNNERNDFSAWIRNVQKDYTLADRLQPSMNLQDCLATIADHIYQIYKIHEKCNPDHVKMISGPTKHLQIPRTKDESIELAITHNENGELIPPEGGEHLVEAAESANLSNRIDSQMKKAKTLVDVQEFTSDMKKVFSIPKNKNKNKIDQIKKVCENDK